MTSPTVRNSVRNGVMIVTIFVVAPKICTELEMNGIFG